MSIGRPLAAWASSVILALSIVSCTGDDGAGEAGDDPTSAGSGVSELEYVRALAECMEDAGWEMSVDESVPSVESVGVADDQIESYNQAFKDCDAQVEQPDTERLSDEQIRELYDVYVDMKACLEDLGYSISEPPSVETFVADYYTEDAWYPYLELPDMANEEEWLRVNEQCPQPEVEGE